MRVLVDGTAVPPDRGGVGRYVDALLPALARAGVQVAVACRPADAEVLGETGARPVVVPGATDRRAVRLAWEQTGLPLLVRRTRADVVLSPHYTMPMLSPVPVVVTLHDATFFTDPHLHLSVKAPFFRTATRLAVRRASALVVPSEATRDEVLRLLPAARRHADRFHVAYHGVDPTAFRPASDDDVARVRASLGLDGPAVVFLGTIEPRKNVPALVDGWVAAVQGMERPPALVLAGARGWDDTLEDALRRVPPGLRVVVPGYVPYEDLAPLLTGADVVAYPSLGEGFGLPVLEAMACGATVLTTRRLSLPEVGGDAVAYTEPDAPAIARALRALLDDPVRRSALGAAARARAAGFTWDGAAQVHVRAFEDALRGTRRGRTVPPAPGGAQSSSPSR
ncbi:glycosyltransferase family 4 protein [Cellulomonas fimi]|uniref:glycosyltransferase family 4 protein n=1 Tax=Cellulomonas fimi TaxID=1708 RepID=UPI00234DE757|nr:glycosyltransferase family 1 protein [Cellulomonas fimi]MDC7122976.1 glycosyltransferase family 4 protein [Cellulomonas fimi]